jgi:GABA permease
MRRYLVVANRTVCGEHLLEHMRDLTERDPDGVEFDVVVPATPAPHGGWTEGESEHAAKLRLVDALERFEAAGVRANGTIGDANPVLAVLDACRNTDYDGIILSTLPAGPSRWLKRDLPKRIERAVNVPLEHVVADAAYA